MPAVLRDLRTTIMRGTGADDLHAQKQRTRRSRACAFWMSLGGSQEAWFPEPSISDDSAGSRGEPPTEWLKRSTHPRAQAARRFLNRNLHALPPEYRSVLHRTLHERWHSAFFELVVGRTLQILGATIEVEPGDASDKRIDFVAHFPNGTIVVEAVSPVFDSEVGETIKRRNPLLDIVESESPPDVWVMVNSLPDLGPQDSRKPFRRTIRKLLVDATQVGYSPVDVAGELPEGTVSLTLMKKGPDVPPGRSVGVEPALTSWDNTEQRVRRAVTRKRRQVKEAAVPALVAVHATGISSSYEEFDQALFGRDVSTMDSRGRLLGTRFQADGIFATGSGEPTWAAALAFVNVGFLGGPDPVLYLHPRFKGRLPDTLLTLEKRTYDVEAGKPIVQGSSRIGALNEMGFVSQQI